MKRMMLPFLVLLLCAKSFAAVKPNSLFSNNMVLQRGVAVPVWGTAKDGEKVTVEFEGQKQTTVAQGGKWSVKLNPLKAGGPFKMVISGENVVTIDNVLVGEVWVCGGQSNMERQLGLRNGQKPILNWQEEAATANFPLIRQYQVARNASDTPIYEAKSKWVICDTASVKNFSAVGFFFGRALHKKLNVPIGLLFSAVGGTPAENWTTRAALENDTALLALVKAYDKSVVDFPAQLEKFKLEEKDILAKWVADTLVAAAAGKPIPKKPTIPKNPATSGACGGLYNAMINPLVPYAIKGVIWYQGEANNGRAKQYQKLFPTLIKDWRSNWKQGDFPFLFVQIAPFKGMTPEIREAQLLSLQKVNNVAMVVTTDCGDSADIHPSNKQPVGERLSLAARALAYQEKIIYSGPLYKSYAVKDNAVTISFDHVSKGLVAKDGDLKGFTISADGKKFVPAKAIIKGNTVVVTGDGIAAPKAVRYGWASVPDVNLFNSDNLPASPFRTDVPE